MKNSMTTSSLTSDQSFPDDVSVMTSSVGQKRISRKPNQSTASRRSLSRRSSENSEGKPEPECFFIKMSSLVLTSDSSQTSNRNTILSREENRKEKKRSPTPVPGYLSKKKEREREKSKQEMEVENELMLAEFQLKYNNEREKARVLEKRVQQVQREVKAKMRQIEQISSLLVISQERQKETDVKLRKYQMIVTQNQSSLTQTKTKLERLKNTIKLNRYSELETDNAKLRNDKERITQRIIQLERENKELNGKCIFFEKELFVMKHQLEQPPAEKQNCQENDSLENVLLSRDCYTKKLEARIEKLEIQLAFSNRKKLEEIEQWKEKKDKELNRVRTRLTNLNRQLKDCRVQNQILRTTRSSLPLSNRKSLMSSETWATHEQIFCLSLSPQHFEC